MNRIKEVLEEKGIKQIWWQRNLEKVSVLSTPTYVTTATEFRSVV